MVFQTFGSEPCVQIKSYKKMQINIIDDSRVGLVLSQVGETTWAGFRPLLKSIVLKAAGWFNFCNLLAGGWAAPETGGPA